MEIQEAMAIVITGTELENLTADQINARIPYWFDSTKSTISAGRIKIVGKNLFHPKHALKNPQYSIREYLGVQCLSWVAGDNMGDHRKGEWYGLFMDGMFEKGKRYMIIADMAVASGDARLCWFYDDGTYQSTPRSLTVDSFTRIISTSAAGKNVVGIGGMWNNGQRVYVRLDTFQIQKADASREYEPYMESNTYFVAKDPETNEILQLRSVPNGIKDEINLTQGKLIKRVSNEVVLDGSYDWVLNTTDDTRTVVKLLPADASLMFPNSINSNAQPENNSAIYGYNADMIFSSAIPTGTVGRVAFGSGSLFIGLPLPNSTLADAKNYLNNKPVKLIYQLAEPVEIPVQVSGTLLSYPSGTMYVENVVADAGLYNNGIIVLHQDLPIKSIEKISKIDYETGLETILDASKAVIASDKLSFTHPDLSEGDIVFFEYEYDVESTEGETEVEFYDSRYVVKDTETGKFYKWNIVVANGQPSIELVEV